MGSHGDSLCALPNVSSRAVFRSWSNKKNSNPTNLFNRLWNFTKTRQCGFESFYKTFDVSNCMEHSRFLLGVATGGCLRLSPEGLLGSSFWIVLHQLGGPVFGPFNIFYPLTLEVATGVASLLSAECLLASHFESFSINLTGFRTIEKNYPQLWGLLQEVVFDCQPNGRLVTPFASFPID